jgi:vacuolar protein sorting-associated protein 35
VLPKLVEQIVSCKDIIAQQYLMECIIQVFPDDFHLKTLDTILSTCGQLSSGVNLKTILVSLIDRLANYSTRGEQIPSDIQVFTIFTKNIKVVVEVFIVFYDLLIDFLES